MYSFLGKLGSSKSSKKHGRSGLTEAISFSKENHGLASLKVPELAPSPIEDCDRLKKSFDGLGTDEKEVIRILGHRNARQRRQIRETYQRLYNESLLDRLVSELSGDFMKAILSWTKDPAERDAQLARDALNMSKKGVKYLKIIVEIACASSPHHLIAVRSAYCASFDRSFEEEITSNVPHPLQKLLVGLVSSYRYDRAIVDPVIADSEAQILYEAIKAKKLDNDHVIWVLSTRNVHQLRATFESYERSYGNSIEKDIKNCGSGNFHALLQVAICCLMTPEKHFAQVIRDSIVGLGTDEDSLSRAIVTRAEIDTEKIREEYRRLYKNSLDDDVIGDTSGDYKDFLMTLLGAGI